MVGVTFCNDDGTSRQANLRICMPGDAVLLVPQPNNPADQDAVAVVVPGKGQIGYLPRGSIRRGQLGKYSAVLASIQPPDARPDVLGAVLLMSYDA